MKNNPCIICGGGMQPYIKKEKFVSNLKKVNTKDLLPIIYSCCDECGFLLSDTHAAMDEHAWVTLNNEFHHANENDERNELGFNQPPYLEQALMFELLASNGIIDDKHVLDYAAGYGTLSHLLEKYFQRKINNYDKYITTIQQNYLSNPSPKSWSVVINSAMFEHVLTRKDLDSVNDYVASEGALIIHTVVVEKVPKDPNWFYIDIPVHTAVHTNRSMSILMQQWGYQSSIYSPKSKSWALLKKPYAEIKPIVDKINGELQTPFLIAKEGFVDYWK